MTLDTEGIAIVGCPESILVSCLLLLEDENRVHRQNLLSRARANR